jgi:uncharacterized protein YbjT (DUF2867 family)
LPKLDVLVVGSTGRQGGAVARALLRGGHDVRALTRNLAHPAAGELRLRGARLAWADLGDARALEQAARGANAVFVVTTGGPASEARYGLVLAEVARRLEIPHVVYSSALGATDWRDIPDSDGKHEVERYLRAEGVPHTIVCPAFFMENFLRSEWLTGPPERRLRLPLAPGDKLQQLAYVDHAQFVRLVLERRAEFLGRRIGIAADELTPLEIAATARIDITELRERYPEVNWHTLADWARRQDWKTSADVGTNAG